MANRSDHAPELELQLVELVPSKKEKVNNDVITADLITQYRILDKKCDEVLKKIYNRKTKRN